MRALACTILMVLLPGLSSEPVHAQSESNVSTSRMRDAGLALGMTGFFAGNWLGAKAQTEIRRRRGDDLQRCADGCGRTGAVILGVLGGSTGVATGVHLMNNSRGDFYREWLTSLGIGALGTGAVALVARPWDDRPGSDLRDVLLGAVYLIAIPAAQLAATIHIERQTAERSTGSAVTVPLLTVRVPVAW